VGFYLIVMQRKLPPGVTGTATATRRRKDHSLKFAPQKLYPDNSSIWVLYDLRNLENCERLHKARALQGDSDLESLGPNHVVLRILPGGAVRLLP
jgi:hypothetical protein